MSLNIKKWNLDLLESIRTIQELIEEEKINLQIIQTQIECYDLYLKYVHEDSYYIEKKFAAMQTKKIILEVIEIFKNEILLHRRRIISCF